MVNNIVNREKLRFGGDADPLRDLKNRGRMTKVPSVADFVWCLCACFQGLLDDSAEFIWVICFVGASLAYLNQRDDKIIH